jgi:hypothetical protein
VLFLQPELPNTSTFIAPNEKEIKPRPGVVANTLNGFGDGPAAESSSIEFELTAEFNRSSCYNLISRSMTTDSLSPTSRSYIAHPFFS